MISDLLSISSAFGIPFLIKALVPGLIFALLLLPVLNPILPSIVKIDKLSDIATILLPVALIFGLILSLSTSVIYRIYEGRLLWSKRLHEKFTNKIDKRVKEKYAEAENLRQAGDTASVRYKELWYWLRIFPRDDKNLPIATRPTMLGNILDGYEGYPSQRYGMDSIFYWYRLWQTLPENFTKSMDRLWAEADCFMNVSFSAILLFLFYGVVTLIKFTVWFMTRFYISVPESLLYFTLLYPYLVQLSFY